MAWHATCVALNSIDKASNGVLSIAIGQVVFLVRHCSSNTGSDLTAFMNDHLQRLWPSFHS